MSSLSAFSRIKKLPRIALRAVKVLVYYVRVLVGKAAPEPELTFVQKIRSSYILPGTLSVPAPRGYFSQPNSRLRIVDDVAGLPHVLWKNHSQCQLDPPKTASGPPAKVRWNAPSASFILAIKGGCVAPDGLVFDRQAVYRNAKWYYAPPPDSLPIIHVDRLITFIQLWSSEFIHFTFDTLPRLNLAYDFICNETGISILVPDSPFIAKILNALEIHPSRIISQKSGYVYSANVVYYPHFYNHGFPEKMGLLPTGSLDKVRKELSGPYSHPQDRVVYLKRRENLSRSVENEADLLDKVRERLEKGLTLTVYEPYDDWTRDREIMKRARVVLGPHGGAWSNIIFCREDAHVIEFIPLLTFKSLGLNERPCYYGLSSALNLNYWCVEPANFEFDEPGARMRVPLNELMSVLRQIGVCT